MAYTRLGLKDGDKVKAEHVTHVEDGIDELNTDLADIDIMGAVGTAIASGDNLDDYMTAGKYYSQTGTISGSLTNAPFTTAGFNLYIFKQVVAANTVFQFAVRTSTSTANALAFRICSANSWGSWYLLSASALSTTSLSNKPEDGDV